MERKIRSVAKIIDDLEDPHSVEDRISKVKITTRDKNNPLVANNCDIYLNGKIVKGVKSLEFRMDVDGVVPVVKISLYADIEIDDLDCVGVVIDNFDIMEQLRNI